MKIELLKVTYIKNHEFTDEPHPEADLCLIMFMKTRRATRTIAHNANTKETFNCTIHRKDIKLNKKLDLDSHSISMFETALAVYLSGDRELIQKPHRILIKD